MGVNRIGENRIIMIMCNILKTADRRAKRMKFGTRSPRNVELKCLCGILIESDSLSLVWGHSVHFAKFLM